MNKKILFVLALLQLILAGDSCNFTAKDLNNKVLKLDKTGQTCSKCFKTDVIITFTSDSQQITGIELNSVTPSSDVQSLNLKPLTKSLVMNTSFMVMYLTDSGFSASTFMTQCNASQAHGKTVYNLQFKVEVSGGQQLFTLNSEDQAKGTHF